MREKESRGVGKKKRKGEKEVGEKLIPTGRVIGEEEFRMMLKRGELEKVGPGLYRRKKRRIPVSDTLSKMFP